MAPSAGLKTLSISQLGRLLNKHKSGCLPSNSTSLNNSQSFFFTFLTWLPTRAFFLNFYFLQFLLSFFVTFVLCLIADFKQHRC